MAWYAYLAYFFGGASLANGVPHFVHGISGKKFQTPFTRPWSKEQSPPVVNGIWGAANFVIGYVPVFKVGHFEGGFTLSALMVGLGAFVIAVMLALSFGRVREH
jgi:hypothetical protein